MDVRIPTAWSSPTRRRHAAVDLKKEIYFHGLATVEQIDRAISARFGDRAGEDLVRQILLLIDGFCWLDEAAGWFRLLPIHRHGLPKAIDKVLAVAGTVTVGQLHTALSRNRRLWKEPPPENVLLEFCRQMPKVRVEGDRIISDPPRDWRKSLTGVEAKLVERLEGPRAGDGTRRDGRHLRGRRHEPLQLPRLRLLVAGDRPIRPQRLRTAGHEVAEEQVKELLAKRRASPRQPSRPGPARLDRRRPACGSAIGSRRRPAPTR